jgi:hypothetical protein
LIDVKCSTLQQAFVDTFSLIASHTDTDSAYFGPSIPYQKHANIASRTAWTPPILLLPKSAS